jgi:putative capsular polysaccharide biosynthesis protein
LVSSNKEGKDGWLIGIFLLLALIVGMADMLGGYDRYIYCELFDENADSIRSGGPFFNTQITLWGYHKELAYVIWNSLVAYITPNRYLYILITTFFIYTLLFISLRDVFRKYPISILVFMGLWFFFTFTYLRQALAVSCAWLSYKYVMKREFVPFFILWFIAYKFHNSAIIFFIFYFLPQKKWAKSTIVLILIAAFILGVSGVPMTIYHLYDDALDTQRASSYAIDLPGVRYDYIAEVLIMITLIFNRYEKIPEDREHLIYLNGALMFCIILLVFLHSSNAGRQSWYYMLGMIYILSFLSGQNMSFDNYSKAIYLLVTILFLRFVINWGVLISPYKTFLTDGHRENDPVYQEFEYDDRYNVDKFYRPAINIYIP